jgi:hypothetical protein
LAVAPWAYSCSSRPRPRRARVPSIFPERFDWQRRTPQQAGFDPARLDEAVKFAIANENPLPKDLILAHARTYAANEPFDTRAAR